MSVNKIFKSENERKLFLAVLSVLLLEISMLSILLSIRPSPSTKYHDTNDTNVSNNVTPGQVSLIRFSSYEELRDFLNKSKGFLWLNYDVKVVGSLALRAAVAEAKSGSTDVGYSRTNIQVEGVDEADIVKTDGRNIYLAIEGRVLIVKAYPLEEAKVYSEIYLDGIIMGLFVSDGKLTIISSTENTQIIPASVEKNVSIAKPQTLVQVYDLENIEKPVLIRNVTLSGMYFNSRLVGNYVYVLSSFPAYLGNEEPILPEILDGGRVTTINPTSIYYTNASDYYNAFTLVAAINVQEPNEPVTHETFLFGYASCIYVSLNNIYVAVPGSMENWDVTNIHRIRIEGGEIKYEASGAVPGLVFDQFSMDEYNGYFRIATHAFSTWASNVYVLNTSLSVVGKLEGLAPGEWMYSARFMGDRCYMVTFKKVDPLFVISLEDPTNPKILGKLKIPGYSDYLHPYDENHLIGIGKWTTEAEEGDFAWYQGIKISLFDVSDVEHPKETDSIIIGDRGTDSPVLYDHKALLFDRDLNLLAMPILLAEIDESKYPKGIPPNTYGDYVWQGLYVFHITEDSIKIKGRITHIEDYTDLLKSGYWFYSDFAIQRALYIGNTLYTISNRMIKMNDLETLTEIGILKLP
ncbi:MAG: beta-propeller domain-containing protein [Candidatus Bathyarchaeia archaeon]